MFIIVTYLTNFSYAFGIITIIQNKNTILFFTIILFYINGWYYSLGKK